VVHLFPAVFTEQVPDQVDGQVAAAVGAEVLAGAVEVVDLAAEGDLLEVVVQVEVGKYC
jgi:predicted regulator of Ras-like GTPase activity (Roadblock/LC7/MglB family)